MKNRYLRKLTPYCQITIIAKSSGIIFLHFFLYFRLSCALVIGGGSAEIVAKSRQPIKFLSFQHFNNIDIQCFCHLQSIFGSLVCVIPCPLLTMMGCLVDF